jgi:hypothetical protein
MEDSRGYRAECVRLLSRILGVNTETISSKWGSGIDFEKMPEQYEKTLSYANSLREIIDAAGRNPDLAQIEELQNEYTTEATINAAKIVKVA